MASSKTGRPRSMKVTKKKVAAPRKSEGHYFVRTGTPNEMKPIQQFVREAKGRETLRDAVEQWKPWCERYNTAGLAEIEKALEWIANTPFRQEIETHDMLLDERYAVTVRLQHWMTSTEEKK